MHTGKQRTIERIGTLSWTRFFGADALFRHVDVQSKTVFSRSDVHGGDPVMGG